MQTNFDSEKVKKIQAGFCGEISVFLALITVLTASLILSSVELLRTQAARTYLTVAANSAVDSLFSQYHLELWEQYRLLGLEMYSEKEITAEYSSFLEPYLSKADTWNLYGLSEVQDGVQISEYALLTDENGAVFEKEVKDYMRYGGILDLVGTEGYQNDAQALDSSESMDESAKELEKCSDRAWKLQNKLNALDDTVKEHNRVKQELGQALSQGNGTRVRALIMKLNRCLEAVAESTVQIRTSAARLGEEVDTADADIRQKYTSGQLTEENYGQLSGQLDNYRAYSDESSAQARHLTELEEQVSANEELLVQVESSAEDAEEYIENWVPEQILVRYDPPKKEGEAPIPVYEDEVLDKASVWQETAELFASYEELSFSAGTGAVDTEKAGQLEFITSLLSGSLLTLILPDAEKISKTEHDLTEAPSTLYLAENTNVFNDEDFLQNKISVSEYAMLELSDVLAGSEGFGNPELEYVLCGCKTDYRNVANVAAELIGIRTGLNLTYLLASKEAKVQAGELAVSVTGAAAGTPLVFVITFLILNTWAAGQAVLDVRDLLSGGKVPLMHTKKTFRLTLKGLLTEFKKELIGERVLEIGMEYREYLRLLLYTRSGSKTDYRIMDVIQENLRKEQEDFRMDRLYTLLDLSVSAGAKHVFITPGILAGRDYRLTVNTYYAYSE